MKHILISTIVGVLSMAVGWWVIGIVSIAVFNELAEKLKASNEALSKSVSDAQSNLPANVAGAEKKEQV